MAGTSPAMTNRERERAHWTCDLAAPRSRRLPGRRVRSARQAERISMPRRPPAPRRQPQGPSQRQLRAGELVRHALVEIFREEDIADPAMEGVSVTVTEVRVSPDLRHATVFVEPLGGAHAAEVV